MGIWTKTTTGIYCGSTCGEAGGVQMKHVPLYILMAQEFSCITYIIFKVPEEMKEKQNVGKILQG